MFRLEGITAAVFTPFHENGDLNLEPISAYIDCLVKDGVTNAFICGTNGEGWSLTVDERKLVAEHWKKVNNGRSKVAWGQQRSRSKNLVNMITGAREGAEISYLVRRLKALALSVSAAAVRDSQELAAHAESIGIDAIACTPPAGFKAKNFDNLIKALGSVAEKAPKTPFYHYHLDASNMNNIGDMEELLKAVAANPIPNFSGMKFSSINLYEFKKCLLLPQGYQILSGADDQLLAVVAVGGYEFIGGTVNFQGKLFNGVIEAYKKKDLETAGEIYNQFVEHLKVIRKHGGGVPLCKTLMKLTHIDLGPCRAPLHRVTTEEETAFRKDLEEVGYFRSDELLAPK